MLAAAAVAAVLQAAAPAAATGPGDCRPDRVTLFPEGGPADGVSFTVEVADEPAEQARGLMYRTEMAENAGMIFLFDPPRPASFWMKNTVLPLDMIFIADDGRVANVAARTTPMSERSLHSEGAVRAVLEVNAGLAEAHNIGPGTPVRHPSFRAARGAHACGG